MPRVSRRTAAVVPGICALAFAGAPAAHAQTVSVAATAADTTVATTVDPATIGSTVAAAVPRISIDRAQIQRAVGSAVRRARVAEDRATSTARGVGRLTGTALARTRRAADGVSIRPVALTIGAALQRLGVAEYVVIDSDGHVLRSGATSVTSRGGAADVTWDMTASNCTHVALRNGVVPRALLVDESIPLHTIVGDVQVGAALPAVSLSALRGVTIASLCR